ncbi:MAG: hypothetical protein CMI17_08625 [Opitutaceae bacterium]|nr:hypothetical protein [Opitutaceae bacterium]
MEYLAIACQIIVGLGILNVWVLRFKKPSPYRGGQAINMTEEFAAYGLPAWSVAFVGVVKVSAAIGLLVGLFIPQAVLPSSLVLAFLMLGAVAWHIKIKDPPAKSMPAATILLLTAFLAFYSNTLQI